MRLISATSEFFVWLYKLTKVLLKVKPVITPVVVFAVLASKITYLLAFVLPLKVILLAGSDRVPRYFAFFIEEDKKIDWIIGLSAAAVLSYFLTLILDAISKKLTLQGGIAVAKRANSQAVLAKYQDTAQTYYSQITGIHAALMFGVLGSVLLFFIYPTLLEFLILLALFQLAITLIIFQWMTKLSDWVIASYKYYVGILASITFLAGFLFILWPYIDDIATAPNIIISLISIIMLKLMVNALSTLVNNGMALTNAKEKVNALHFIAHKFKPVQSKAALTFHQIFSKPSRQALFRKQLNLADDEQLDVTWQDSQIRGINRLGVTITDKTGQQRCMVAHIFSAKFKHLLDSEHYLFSRHSRDKLNAPKEVCCFEQDKFTVQLCEVASLQRPTARQWRRQQWALLTQMWQNTPSKALLKEYWLSHKPFHEKIDETMLAKLHIAIENEADRQLLQTFIDQWPAIQQKIKQLPLYIHNHNFKYDNAIPTSQMEIQLQNWSHWGVLPIGAVLPRRWTEKSVAQQIKRLSSLNKTMGQVEIKSVTLVRKVRVLQIRLAKARYKQSLSIIRSILSESILEEEFDDNLEDERVD